MSIHRSSRTTRGSLTGGAWRSASWASRWATRSWAAPSCSRVSPNSARVSCSSATRGSTAPRTAWSITACRVDTMDICPSETCPCPVDMSLSMGSSLDRVGVSMDTPRVGTFPLAVRHCSKSVRVTTSCAPLEPRAYRLGNSPLWIARRNVLTEQPASSAAVFRVKSLSPISGSSAGCSLSTDGLYTTGWAGVQHQTGERV
jgi:hypothetical protein